MEIIFKLSDKFKKKIHLSKERYKHIQKHPYMHDSIDDIKNVIKNLLTIRYNEEDKNVRYFYKEFKEKKNTERYLLVSVKYLNGEGFTITSFYTNKITGLKWKIR